MRVQFGRAAGEIQRVHGRGIGQQFEDALDRGHLHDLGALGARLDMAMLAGQVAKLPDIDLQDFPSGPRQRQPVLAQRACEGHG